MTGERLKRLWKAFFIFVMFTGIILIYHNKDQLSSRWAYHGHRESNIAWKAWKEGGNTDNLYLIDTEGCRLLALDPWDPAVIPFLHKYEKLPCRPSLIKLEDQTLVYNKELLRSPKFQGVRCCYREITRVEQSPDNYNKTADKMVKVGDTCLEISHATRQIVLHNEYILVECSDILGVQVQKEVIAVILPPKDHSPETRRKADFWDSKVEEVRPFSVIIIALDSVSRLNMQRSLPRTGLILGGNDFIEMKGHMKVGGTTFPCIMAGLAGRGDRFQDCWPNAKSKLDDCPFIWKNFSQDSNYMTAFLEDRPKISIFNYYKVGFVKRPADYYLRPAMLAHNEFVKGRCFGSKSSTELMSSFIQNLTSTFGRKYPYFLLSWFTDLGHDDLNKVQTGDRELVKLLKNLVKEEGENAVIFFMSDHGIRRGRYRETFQGFYEDHLPFMFVRLPPKLKSRMPQWDDALQVNNERLTTPYDLYGALVDLYNLEFPTRPLRSNRSESLFRISSPSRNCLSSQVPQGFCMCGVNPEMETNSSLSTSMAYLIVSKVNEEIANANLTEVCASLELNTTLSGRQVGNSIPYRKPPKPLAYTDFLVRVETSPGGARFEAKVRVDEKGQKEILDQVNRINSYEGQSECLSDYKMKNYCYCKTILHL